MKKIVFILILFISSFLLVGCKKEYKINDSNLKANYINDNYRNYYQIFVGSFSDSNGDGIGDLKGIINRLDYLNDGDFNSGKSLGITGIWLNPIMPSPSYHKYDIVNYKTIDSSFGDLNDFKELIKEAKKRNINVIIDLVINHTSIYHPWFKKFKQAVLDDNINNKYYSYYKMVTKAEMVSYHGHYFHTIKNDRYYEGNFSDQMPELNFDNPNVKNEIIDIVKFWLDLGVAGFRLDAAKYIYFNEEEKNIDFWTWFTNETKKIKNDVYIVGEVFDSDDIIIPYYKNFSNFDFGIHGGSPESSLVSVIKGYESVNSYIDYIISYKNKVTKINPNAILAPFISNHDIDRPAGIFSETKFLKEMANFYILSYGTPFIYYGEEIGMKGSRTPGVNTDADRRLAMLWGDNDKVQNPIGSTYSNNLQIKSNVQKQILDKESLYNHYKKLLMIRNAYPEIARGNYTNLNLNISDNVGGFIAQYNQMKSIIIHNVSNEDIIIDLGKHLTNGFSKVLVTVGTEGSNLNGTILTLKANTSAIIK